MRDFSVLFRALAPIPLLLSGCATSPGGQATAQAPAAGDGIGERVAHYAELYDVPESLIRRSIQRESGFDPSQHAGPYWGLMQIRFDTARGMGYRGTPKGLLDVDTNLKYSVAYLSNAYVVAGGNANRALTLYASGYFWEARRKHMLDRLKTANDAEASKQASAATP